MRRQNIQSSIMLLGVLGMALGGCPVWGPGGTPVGPSPRVDGGVDAYTPPDSSSRPDSGRGDSMSTPDGSADTGPASCNANTDCQGSQYCDTTTRTCVPATACGAGCPTGFTCDSRGLCVPGCRSDAPCIAQAAGLVCDLASARCVPGNQCSASNPCPSGQSCINGACRQPTEVCEFAYQCSAGQDCVDGRCRAQCSPSRACPTGQVCTNGYCGAPASSGTCNCTANQVCVSGACQMICTTDAQCGTGNFCDHGACRVDDRRPAPFCTPPANGCAAGSNCVDGVCRIACPSGTNNECLMRDTNFPTCNAGICQLANESAPQCRANTCPSGQLCVNGACR